MNKLDPDLGDQKRQDQDWICNTDVRFQITLSNQTAVINYWISVLFLLNPALEIWSLKNPATGDPKSPGPDLQHWYDFSTLIHCSEMQIPFSPWKYTKYHNTLEIVSQEK